MLTIGKKAPAITLQDQKGQKQTLSQYKGGYVLVYFYPKAMTPGCVKEACGFRDILKDLKKAKITVLGISLDDESTLKQFAKQDKINFPLLSDSKRRTSALYDVLKSTTDKKGKVSYSLPRVSYLVGGKGMIVKVYTSIVPEKHALQVLKDVTMINEANKKVETAKKAPVKAIAKTSAKAPAKNVAKVATAQKAPAKGPKAPAKVAVVPKKATVASVKKGVTKKAVVAPVKKGATKKSNIENPVILVEEIAVFEIEE